MNRREFIGVSASSAAAMSLATPALGGENATVSRARAPLATRVSESVATRTEVAGTHGLVTGGHEAEAAAGIAMIQSGGNAIDALVAAAFVGFVVEPANCGLGGYGRLAVRLGRDKRFVTFDHYVRAPGAARSDMFEIDRSKPLKYYGFPYTVGMRAEEGPLAPAVPGAVAGLCDAHAMFGRLKLAQVPEPAIGAAEARAAGLALDRALPRPVRAGDPWPFDAAANRPTRIPDTPGFARLEGTTQMACADAEGNVCALITSLTSGFGSLMRVPGTGVVLNNSMQNFDPRPDQANCIKPGKMPIFAAPSLVTEKDGRAVFAGCGSGGYRITTGVIHAFLHAVDFGLGPQEAIDAPRVHCQGQQTYVDPRIPQEERDGLARLGHDVLVVGETPGANPYGRINAIAIGNDGVMRAGTGPSWSTAAAAW